MIWLASFPRSGNTFLRNILFEVYGIASSTFHCDPTRELDADYEKYRVIKTHELPNKLPEPIKEAKAVYLVRDARDALVSIAHHRKDIVEPGSDYYNNLLEVITADGGDGYFGGWSKNLTAWRDRASLIIHFEDLIEDPLSEVEKLRQIMDLPEPDVSKMPTFEKLKFGRPQYGAGSGEGYSIDLASKHFRKGEPGSWKEELPKELENLIYDIHGEELSHFNYIDQIPPKKQKKVLIEADKLFRPQHDGVKRYQLELLQNLRVLQGYKPDWIIDLFYEDNILSLDKLEKHLLQDFSPKVLIAKLIKEEVEVTRYSYESKLMRIKADIKRYLPPALYQFMSWPYRMLPFRAILNFSHDRIKQNKVKKVVREFERRTDRNKTKAYDIIHIPLPQHLSFVRDFKGVHVVTVHDLSHELFPQFHTEDNIKKSKEGMKQIVKRQLDIVAISEATKQDLIRLYKYPEEKIRLIYEGANSEFKRSGAEVPLEFVLERYGLPNTRYFITLSTLEPRKNLRSVIQAFLEFQRECEEEISLFICGAKGWKIDDLFNQQEELQSDHIYFAGFIDDDDLPVLFSNAHALCYLSIYEGFGLPILESMKCGTPVIFGDNSSMPEVAGGGGIGVDVLDIEGIKSAMHRIVVDVELKRQLGNTALLQAKKFSWLKAALETLQYFEELIEDRDL